MLEMSFDASSMEALERDLRESALRMHEATDAIMPEIAEIVATAAKAIVEPHSKSIKVRPIPTPGVAVVHAEAPDSPLARLYEFGGSKGRTSRGKVRYAGKRTMKRYTARGLQSVSSFAHPVFKSEINPDPPWVDQQRFPYLRPARRVVRKQVDALMNKAWDEGLRPVFRR